MANNRRSLRQAGESSSGTAQHHSTDEYLTDYVDWNMLDANSWNTFEPSVLAPEIHSLDYHHELLGDSMQVYPSHDYATFRQSVGLPNRSYWERRTRSARSPTRDSSDLPTRDYRSGNTRSSRRSNGRSNPAVPPTWSHQPMTTRARSHPYSESLPLYSDFEASWMPEHRSGYAPTHRYHTSSDEAPPPIAISSGTSPVDLYEDDYAWNSETTNHHFTSPTISVAENQPLVSNSLRSARSFADLRSFTPSPRGVSPSPPASATALWNDDTHASFGLFQPHTQRSIIASSDMPLVSSDGEHTRSHGLLSERRRARRRDRSREERNTSLSPRRRHAQYSTQLVDSMNQKSHAPAEHTTLSTESLLNLEDSMDRTDKEFKLLLNGSVANHTLKQMSTSLLPVTDQQIVQSDSFENEGSRLVSDSQSTNQWAESGSAASPPSSGIVQSQRQSIKDWHDAVALLKENLNLTGGYGLTVLCNQKSRASTVTIRILDCSDSLDFIRSFEGNFMTLLSHVVSTSDVAGATPPSHRENTSEAPRHRLDAIQLVYDLDAACENFWEIFANAGLGMSSWMPDLSELHADMPTSTLFNTINLRAEVWVFTLQMIDLMVLCHNSSHIVDLKAHFGWDPHVDDWYPRAPSLALREKLPVFRRRALACLGGMLDNTPVWVLQAADDNTEGNCLVSCTASEIAAAWGDVYGVQGNPVEGFESFRIPLGFVLPWKPSESQSSLLAREERYCHWVPEIAYLARKRGHMRALSEYGPWRLDRNAPSLKITDRMLIGMEPLPSMQLKPCTHNQIMVDDAFFKDSLERDLGTLPSRTWWDPTFQIAGGFHVTATLIGKRQREQITQKQALIDKWALDDNWGSPRDLESMWGVMVSRCTLNAKRVRIRDLLKTPTMRYEIDDCRWTVPGLKNRFIEAVLSPDETAILALWDRHNDEVRQELRRIILSLLRTLAQSGISRKENNSSDTDRFDILWRPDSENRMKVATINASSHPWVTFLRDRHYSSCMAVMVEEEIRLSGRFHHGRHSYRSVKPSALETVVKITQPPTQLQCAYYLLDSRGTVEHPPWPVHRNWAYALKFSPTPPGLALELKSGKLRIERALGDWYLVTRWKESKARQAAQSLGFNMEERRDVCEELEKFDRAQLRPVPVHIIGGIGWYEERRRVG